MGLFQPSTETAIVLECVNGYDSLIVVVKWILVQWNLVLNLCHTNAIKSNKRNCKAVPNFFLELSQDTLERTHKNTFTSTSTNHFAKEDSDLDSLTETYAISNKKTRTR